MVRDDRPEARVADYRPHQGHVELELVDRPAAQALQRGEARAEVVQRDVDAELGELREEARARDGGPGLLAHLEDEHAAGHPLAPQQPPDDGGEPGSVTQPGPTLTETGMFHPSAAQARCCASDSLSIRRVSSLAIPSSSATGMNTPGDRVPSSGCSHRASTPPPPPGRTTDRAQAGNRPPAARSAARRKLGTQPRRHVPASTAIAGALLCDIRTIINLHSVTNSHVL